VTPSTLTVTVFTRHTSECDHKDNPKWKQCKCSKHLYIYENGRVSYKSARTRSYTQAQSLAEEERKARDPKTRDERAKDCTLSDALDQWCAGASKDVGVATGKAYSTFKNAVLTWAASKNIVMLSDVTSDALDTWVTSWSGKANTRKFRLSRLRALFLWCQQLHKVNANPAAPLRNIKRGKHEDDEKTWPLTPDQFEELIAATHEYDKGRRVDKDRFGVDLRAIFLTQRWTGLRLSDVLLLRRDAVRAGRITLKTQKTGDDFDRPVPKVVLEALAVVPVRKTMHKDYYFWSTKCDHRVLAGMWTPRIKRMNKYVHFKDEKGNPLAFRSHMLRDTYAVELLLAGVLLEQVSKLLTHKSTRVTEQHYAPWVRARQDQLDEVMKQASRTMGASFTGD